VGVSLRFLPIHSGCLSVILTSLSVCPWAVDFASPDGYVTAAAYIVDGGPTPWSWVELLDHEVTTLDEF
jgi:hypothetical protein